jgi:hypothetical protein
VGVRRVNATQNNHINITSSTHHTKYPHDVLLAPATHPAMTVKIFLCRSSSARRAAAASSDTMWMPNLESSVSAPLTVAPTIAVVQWP